MFNNIAFPVSMFINGVVAVSLLVRHMCSKKKVRRFNRNRYFYLLRQERKRRRARIFKKTD